MSTEITGLADPVILPDTFYAYTMIDSAADDIHQHVAALKRDATANRDAIRATAEGARWYSDFASFDNQWVDWYAANRFTAAGLFRDLTGTSIGAVRNFGARFNALEARFRALGFTPTATGGPGPNPTIPDDVMHGIYVVGGILGLGLVGWLAYSASKFAPAVNVAAERFRTFRPSMSGLGATAARYRVVGWINGYDRGPSDLGVFPSLDGAQGFVKSSYGWGRWKRKRRDFGTCNVWTGGPGDHFLITTCGPDGQSLSGFGARPHRGHWDEEGNKKSSTPWFGKHTERKSVREYDLRQFAGSIQASLAASKRGDCAMAQSDIWQAQNYAFGIIRLLPKMEESLLAKIEMAENAMAECSSEHGRGDAWQRKYDANARAHGSMSRARTIRGLGAHKIKKCKGCTYKMAPAERAAFKRRLARLSKKREDSYAHWTHQQNANLPGGWTD